MNFFKLVVIISICIFGSCANEVGEEVDYRNSYLGDFNFTVIEEYWLMGEPTVYDTLNYLGIIKEYAAPDSENDFFVEDDSAEDPMRKISIEFLENKHITSEIIIGGELISKSGYHYHHEGTFIGNDTIKFVLSGLGGLGGGINYEIKGIRN